MARSHGANRRRALRDFASSLGLTLGLKGRYSMFTADASASLNRSVTEDAYSESFVFVGDYDNGDLELDSNNYELTELGKSARQLGTWQQTCGDEYVAKVNMGARFYFVFRLDFDSTDAKSKFDQAAKVSASFGAGSIEVSDTLTIGMSAVGSHAHLHAEAMQMGGDPSKLGTVFAGATSTVQSDPTKPPAASAVLDCAQGTIKSCITFMSNALDYASSSNPGSLQSQLSDPTKFAPTEYTTLPWITLAIPATPLILTQQLADDRNRLSATFEQNSATRLRVERIINGGFELPGSLGAQLQKVEGQLQVAQTQTDSAVTSCYDALQFDPATGTLKADSVAACDLAAYAVPVVPLDTELLNGAAAFEIDEKANLMALLGAPLGAFAAPPPPPPATAAARDCSSQPTSDSRGKFCDFINGSVFWTAGTGAFEVDGVINARYNRSTGQLGIRTQGPLGFPTSDVTITPDGAGHFSSFENGAIYVNKSGAAVATYGTIGQYYAAQGAKNAAGAPVPGGAVLGPLGYPLTEPANTFDYRGQYARFENGAVVTSTTPGTGTHVINAQQEALWLSTYGTATSLGFPTSDDIQEPSYNGDYATFQMGTIATSNGVSRFLQSDMTSKWRQDIGILGYPVNDEVPDARAGVKHAQFLNGWIYNVNGTDYTLTGGVFGAWAATWNKPWSVDLPAGDAQDTSFNAHGGGKQQPFGGGMIYTGPGTGSHAVSGAIWYNLRLRSPSSSAEYNCGWPTGDMMLGSQFFHVASNASPTKYIDSYGSKIDDWYIQSFQNGWLAATLDQKHAYVHCGGRNGRM